MRYNYYMIHAGEFKKFKKVVLAVSGGRDSMCLLHYFIAGADKLPPFSVLNFEHGLRGEESRGDSDFVKARKTAWNAASFPSIAGAFAAFTATESSRARVSCVGANSSA